MPKRKGFQHPEGAQAKGLPIRRGRNRARAVLRRIHAGMIARMPSVERTGIQRLPSDPLEAFHVCIGGRPLNGRPLDVRRLAERLDTGIPDLLEAQAYWYESVGFNSVDPATAYHRLAMYFEQTKPEPMIRDLPDTRPTLREYVSTPTPRIDKRLKEESRRLQDPRTNVVNRHKGWLYGNRFTTHKRRPKRLHWKYVDGILCQRSENALRNLRGWGYVPRPTPKSDNAS